MSSRAGVQDVFSAREVARAAGVPESQVFALIEAGDIRVLPIGSRQPLIGASEALRVGTALAAGIPLASSPAALDRTLFAGRGLATPKPRAPFAVSSLAHAGAVAVLVLATSLGFGQTVSTQATAARPEKLRLVYLTLPGPGGGGGGGGLKQPAPSPKAKRRGSRALSSPLPVRRPPPAPKPIERPKEEIPKVEPLPPVEAPVATVAADDTDRAGVIEEQDAPQESRGPGASDGAGSGEGTGVGEGEGAGIGEGSGGGTGGGPFRPGSGIDPPALLREVKPDYSEDARRRGVEGDVVMEIVVRHDGSVGDVRVLQGLGYGLDERAVQAVRQWQFSPARRRGQSVDVIVEVAMEFKIR